MVFNEILSSRPDDPPSIPDLAKTSAIETGPIVPANIAQTLEQAAIQTGDPRWSEALKAESRGEMTEDGERMIDGLVGLRLIAYDSGSCLKAGEEVEVFLAALAGDNDAQARFEAAIDIARNHDKKLRERIMTEHQEFSPIDHSTSERLSYSDFSMVHCTKHKPTLDRTTGRKRIIELFSTSAGTMRGTVHSSLNHVVESHMSGNWDEQPFVVVAPLEKVVALNGEPVSAVTYDTWFSVKPGKGLQLPEEAIFVCPGASSPVQENLGSQEIRYMNIGFTAEHATEIIAECSDDQLWDLAGQLGIKGNFTFRTTEFQDTKYEIDELRIDPEIRDKIKSTLCTLLERGKKTATKILAKLCRDLAVRQALSRQNHQMIETGAQSYTQFRVPYGTKAESIQDDWNTIARKRGMRGEHDMAPVSRLEIRSADVSEETKRWFYNPYDKRSPAPDTVPLATLHMLYRVGVF